VKRGWWRERERETRHALQTSERRAGEQGEGIVCSMTSFWDALLLGYANLDQHYNKVIILKSTELKSVDILGFQTHFYENQVK